MYHTPYKVSQPCSHGNSVNNVYVTQRVTLVRVLEGRSMDLLIEDNFGTKRCSINACNIRCVLAREQLNEQ